MLLVLLLFALQRPRPLIQPTGGSPSVQCKVTAMPAPVRQVDLMRVGGVDADAPDAVDFTLGVGAGVGADGPVCAPDAVDFTLGVGAGVCNASDN
jgi:hypothetical protein